MDSIAAIGFGIHVNAYGEESNEFLANANSIFNNFIGLGAKINGKIFKKIIGYFLS